MKTFLLALVLLITFTTTANADSLVCLMIIDYETKTLIYTEIPNPKLHQIKTVYSHNVITFGNGSQIVLKDTAKCAFIREHREGKQIALEYYLKQIGYTKDEYGRY